MGLSTTYTKVETDYLLQKLESELVSGLKGELAISDTAPTTQGLYILSDVGTYTNLGGLVTTAGKVNYAYFDGTTWSKVEVDIFTNPAKAPQWVAGTYTAGAIAYDLGNTYRVKDSSPTTTERPSTIATNWEQVGGKDKRVDNLFELVPSATNIFDEYNLMVYRIDHSRDGSAINNNGDYVTGFVGAVNSVKIPVQPNVAYRVIMPLSGDAFRLENSAGVRILSSSWTNGTTFPSNVAYIIIGSRSLAGFMNLKLCKEEDKDKLKQPVLNSNISFENNKGEIIKAFSNTIKDLNDLPFFKTNVNLINPYRCFLKTYINTDGSVNPIDGWYATDFIEVKENVVYTAITGLQIRYYDANKVIIQNITWNKKSAFPAGVKYIRLTGGNNVVTNYSQITDFLAEGSYDAKIPFDFTFNPGLVNVVDSTIRSIIMPHSGKKIFCVGDSYTMQGSYFSELLKVTGLVKVGDTGTSGNGQPFTYFPKNIVANKSLIMQSKFVTLMGGTNDYNHGGSILGTINDCINIESLKKPILKVNTDGTVVRDDSVDNSYKVLTEEDINNEQVPQSVYAAIMTCVKIINSWDKSITIVLCSQPERLQYGGNPNPAPPAIRLGINMNTIASAMREISETFGVPFFDFHSVGWTIDQVPYYMNDGTLHPNAIGGEKIGRGLGKFINTL